MYRSRHGNLLVAQKRVVVPTLTVENDSKWYEIYLIEPLDRARPYLYEEYLEVAERFPGTVWGDHVINPDFVQFLAEEKGFHIDAVSYEVIVGRWVTEHLGKY